MRSERELLVDCLRRLNGLRVPYMLVGSMASNYWGIPRSTHDLDIVLWIEPTQTEELAKAFARDFFVQKSSIERAFAPPYQFNAIDELSALKIDFWLLRDVPFERAAFARRLQVDLFGEQAWITTAEDVVLHKLYWNRLTPSERQLTDAAGVCHVQAGALDVAYLQIWAARLGVEEKLADLLSGKISPKST
ncbi:MAG: hypothetical protein K2Y37_15205 [Pirellulales bacterium]|nr:hypothetical protein [Pirellulales bacterium]